MKLIKRTSLYSLKWVLPVALMGSILCFYMIEYISHEETDEFLTYEMERLIDYHDKHNLLPDFHKVDEIIPDEYHAKPVFKDTLLLETGDNEMVPNRELRFTIRHNRRNFTIVLRYLLLGPDDILEGTLLIVFGIMLLIALFLTLILNRMVRKVWLPFYQSLKKLRDFRINEPVPDFPKTSIDEFDQLNSTLEKILKKISDDFHHNKEFNENMSHELQTQLAIIRGSTENMINSMEAESAYAHDIRKIYAACTQLTQIQKSLLLLSRISNEEFRDAETVDMKQVLDETLHFFADAIELRNIHLENVSGECHVTMYSGLAAILFSNLVKNAVKHNRQHGEISIRLSPDEFVIENTGLPYSGDPQELVSRFAKGPNGNWGIGLSIVQKICELHHFALQYAISDEGRHRITIRFVE